MRSRASYGPKRVRSKQREPNTGSERCAKCKCKVTQDPSGRANKAERMGVGWFDRATRKRFERVAIRCAYCLVVLCRKCSFTHFKPDHHIMKTATVRVRRQLVWTVEVLPTGLSKRGRVVAASTSHLEARVAASRVDHGLRGDSKVLRVKRSTRTRQMQHIR